MTEKMQGDIYLAYLDQILAGEKDIGPIVEVEIEELLMLAKTMLAAGFSINSKTRERLRKRILDQVSK